MPEALVTFTTDFEDPSSIEDLASVGRLYEVGINGHGFMLFDGRPEYSDLVYRRSMVPLDPQRFATTSTPFSEAVERYAFTGWRDWTAGAGQRLYDMEGSDRSAFFDSRGIDPFSQPGALTLLPTTVEELSTAPDATSAGNRFAAASDGTTLFYVTGANVVSEATVAGATTSDTYTGVAGDIEGLAYGDVLYVFAGLEGVFKPSDLATAWSAEVGWFGIYAGDRVCMVSGAGQDVFTTLAADGTEEVASGRYTAPSGYTIVDLTASERFVYFAIDSAQGGRVLKWEIGSADAPSVAAEFSGQRVRSILQVAGQLLVRTQSNVLDEAAASTATWRLYRCPVGSDGNASDFILTLEETEDPGETQVSGRMATDGRFVWFPWDRMHGDDTTGVAVLDLATGGWAKNLTVEASGLEVTSQVLLWGGAPALVVTGGGVYRQADDYVVEGWIELSVSDQASALDKVYDDATIVGKPLAASEEFELECSTDLGETYTDPADNVLSTVGSSRKTMTLAKKAKAIGLKIFLRGPGSSTPTLNLVQVKQHPLGLADQLVQVPVNCFDVVSGLAGARLPEQGPGKGAARARALEALCQTRVKFQDVDYADTGVSAVYEVVSVDVRRLQAVHDKHTSRQASGLVALVTLRKAK